jgi:hypothetical protein
MLKTFTPIKALNKPQFSTPVAAIRAIQHSHANQEAFLVIGPGYVFDVGDSNYYAVIGVEGSVKELTDYINKNNFNYEH